MGGLDYNRGLMNERLRGVRKFILPAVTGGLLGVSAVTASNSVNLQEVTLTPTARPVKPFECSYSFQRIIEPNTFSECENNTVSAVFSRACNSRPIRAVYVVPKSVVDWEWYTQEAQDSLNAFSGGVDYDLVTYDQNRAQVQFLGYYGDEAPKIREYILNTGKGRNRMRPACFQAVDEAAKLLKGDGNSLDFILYFNEMDRTDKPSQTRCQNAFSKIDTSKVILLQTCMDSCIDTSGLKDNVYNVNSGQSGKLREYINLEVNQNSYKPQISQLMIKQDLIGYLRYVENSANPPSVKVEGNGTRLIWDLSDEIMPDNQDRFVFSYKVDPIHTDLVAQVNGEMQCQIDNSPLSMYFPGFWDQAYFKINNCPGFIPSPTSTVTTTFTPSPEPTKTSYPPGFTPSPTPTRTPWVMRTPRMTRTPGSTVTPRPVTKDCGTAAVIVMDTSSSMGNSSVYGKSKIDLAFDAARQLVSQLDPSRDQLAVVTYNSHSKLELPLTSDGQKIDEILRQGYDTDGETVISEGIIKGHEELVGPRRKPVNDAALILASDGVTYFPEDALREADLARADDIQVIAIGMDGGDGWFDLDLLKLIAGSDNNYYSGDFAILPEIFSKVGKDLACGPNRRPIQTATASANPRYKNVYLPVITNNSGGPEE